MVHAKERWKAVKLDPSKTYMACSNSDVIHHLKASKVHDKIHMIDLDVKEFWFCKRDNCDKTTLTFESSLVISSKRLEQ